MSEDDVLIVVLIEHGDWRQLGGDTDSLGDLGVNHMHQSLHERIIGTIHICGH